MKLALCLSGHLRTFDQVFQNLKENVLDRYNPDVFLHTWTDSFGHYMHPRDQNHPAFKAGYDTNSDAPTKEYLESVISRLQPKLYKFEDQSIYTEYFTGLGQRYWRYRSFPR